MRGKPYSRRTLRVALPLVAGAAALVLAPASFPAKAPSTKTCSVKNTSLGKRYGTTSGSGLQTAIDAARPGNTIEVSGRCVGNFVIGQSLSLVGRATDGYPVATLDGNRSGSVLRITAGAVAVTGFSVTNGAANDGGGIFVGFATVTLSSSSISLNTATRYGGGIYNSGTLNLVSSSVTRNAASAVAGSGGGIYNGALSLGVVTVDALSSVTGNTPDDCVGCT
jgi:nitrous oxidase accessory protein NosD